MTLEYLPEQGVYCYTPESAGKDPVIETLVAPYNPRPLTPFLNIMYVAMPAQLILALYPYRRNPGEPGFLQERYLNLLYYLAGNPYTRMGDTTIALAMHPRFEPGVGLLPASRLLPIYKLDPGTCRQTYYTVQAVTWLRATRQNIDLAISILQTLLYLTTLTEDAKLNDTLEGSLYAYLAKVVKLGSSKIRSEVQEIARVINIADPPVYNRHRKLLEEIIQVQNTETPQGYIRKRDSILGKILGDPAVAKPIIGRLVREEHRINQYIGTLRKLQASLPVILEENLNQLCNTVKPASNIAYGVTGQFSLYDILLLQKIKEKCGTQETYLLTTGETTINLAVTTSILNDIGDQFKAEITNQKTIKIKIQDKELEAKPILTSYSDPHIVKAIVDRLKQKKTLIVNPISILSL